MVRRHDSKITSRQGKDDCVEIESTIKDDE